MQGRQEWMDLVRGTAVLLVLVLHATVHVPSPALQAVNTALQPFRVPSLLVVSGLLLHRSLAKPPAVYLSGKVRRILWPWVLWMIPMIALWWETVTEGALGFFLLYTHLWYLSVLGVAYVAALVLHQLRVPEGVTALALFTAGWLLAGRSDVGSTYAWFSGFFFAGAASLPLLGRFVRAPGWVVGAVFAAAVLTYVTLGGADRGMTFRPDRAAASLVGVACVIWAAHRVQGGPVVDGLRWIGRESIVTYVAHFPVVVAVHEALDAPLYVEAAVALVCGLAVCLGLTWAAPATRWLYEAPIGRRKMVTTGRA